MLARTYAKVAWIVGFINASTISKGTFCMCHENASRSESVGMVTVAVVSERDFIRDMEEE